jgi:CIC family chloride channel protein
LVTVVGTIGADDGPRQILAALAGHGGTGLPVLDQAGTALIGWVTYEIVLARMHPDIDSGSGGES